MAPPKLGVGLVLAAGLFLLLATPAQAQEEPTTLYATSLYDAIVRAKLTYLQRAVDAAGLTAALSNSTLEATLMAPSNEAFRDLFDDDCELDLPAVVGNAEDDDDNDDGIDDIDDDGMDDGDMDDDLDDDTKRRKLQDDDDDRDDDRDDDDDDDDDDDRPRSTLAARRAAAKRAAARRAAAKRAAAKRAAARRAAAKRAAARKAAARRAFCRRFPRRCRKGGDDDDDKRRRLLDDDVTANATTNATVTGDDDSDRCFAALLTDVAMLTKVLQYHVAAGLLPTTAWPTIGAPLAAPTLLANQSLQLSLDTDDSDDIGVAGILEYDDYEVAGARTSAEIIIGDLQAGAGLVHIIDDVLIPQA